MDISVIGTPDLVERFGEEVRSVCGSAGANWPYPTILLSREGGSEEAYDTPTLTIVVYGSPVRPVPTIPWKGKVRYENDWKLGVPIFDVNAEPIAELVESRVLYILIPLSEDKIGRTLLNMILEDSIEIIMSQNMELFTSEKLLHKKLPQELSTTVPRIFSEFCAGISGWDGGTFDSLSEVVNGRYDGVMAQTRRVMHSQWRSSIAQAIEELRNCQGVRRSFVFEGTLFIESTPIQALDNEVLRLYWSPLIPKAVYELSGVVRDCPGTVFDLLSEGWVSRAFAELARAIGHPCFEGNFASWESSQSHYGWTWQTFGVDSKLPGLDMALMRDDSGVREGLVALKAAVTTLSEIAQREKTLLNVTSHIRRWYVVAQAVALRTMPQFSKVEFCRDEIRLTADNVINRRDGGNRTLGRVIFHMRQGEFSLDIDHDRRIASCPGDAYGNYQRAAAEGRLVACAEILWQHVTVG
jgi:hypothetical protein